MAFANQRQRLFCLHKSPDGHAQIFGPINPSGVAAENKLYWKKTATKSSAEVEHELARKVKPAGMDAITRLLNYEQLDQQGLAELATYLGVQFFRVPRSISHLKERNLQQRDSYLNRLPKRLERLSDEYFGEETRCVKSYINDLIYKKEAAALNSPGTTIVFTIQ